MKKFLLLILVSLSTFSFCGITKNENVSQNIDESILRNLLFIKKLNESFNKQNINIFYSQWKAVVDKKCDWVKKNINIELYGQEDKFSYQLCLVTEQNSFINKLIILIKKNGIQIQLDSGGGWLSARIN